MRYVVSYIILCIRHNGAIIQNRACRANQRGAAIGSEGCPPFTGCGDSLSSVWDFPSASLSLHRRGAPEYSGAFGARTQSRLHDHVAGEPHQAAAKLFASPGTKPERFCRRDPLTFATKEKGAWEKVTPIFPQFHSSGLRTVWICINLPEPMNFWFPRSS